MLASRALCRGLSGADARQIAAMLDKSIPGERAYLFWNIVITHMLAVRGPALSHTPVPCLLTDRLLPDEHAVSPGKAKALWHARPQAD